MRLLNVIRSISAAVARRVAIQRQMSRFNCGDCEEMERCGRSPSEDCIERLTQIERDGDRPRPRSLRAVHFPTDQAGSSA
jgi:hypothetical protein